MFKRTRPLAERFWEKADKSAGPDGCWPWTASTNHGYGQFYTRERPARAAHQVAYELATGPIPDGLEIDHMCHGRDETCRDGEGCPHRRCVNPAHLEAVTHQVNGLRGRSPAGDHARVTHCPQGHEYTPGNTLSTVRGNRRCRTCHREREHARYHAKKE